jgi:FKBP-type peptidyl-prolyl cis-trans isomerase
MKSSEWIFDKLMRKQAHALVAVLLVACCLMGACGTSENVRHPVKTYTKEKLMEANKADSKRESDDIRAYVKHHQWEMQESGTGLQYMFLNHSVKGDSARTGLEARVSYKVFLLNGTLCYSSDKDGMKTFKIGEDHVESGIHEVVLRMKTGDSMRFVLPSNLAHGLLGDGDKIPPRSPVMYEIELISLR